MKPITSKPQWPLHALNSISRTPHAHHRNTSSTPAQHHLQPCIPYRATPSSFHPTFCFLLVFMVCCHHYHYMHSPSFTVIFFMCIYLHCSSPRPLSRRPNAFYHYIPSHHSCLHTDSSSFTTHSLIHCLISIVLHLRQ
ncbi:hypothetical protein E2C01_072310 [Portunus trituberculatus]|uniref:Uncharacterized protein n=1 Tax=Portunus trituberculatus TaxID=210409 RepID=A0A5B7HXM1_PORTR|nr:hypothetical protein [Portunus trituberculatus]